MRWYFYPRPPRGGRPTVSMLSRRRTYFYPRPPRGGRPRSELQELTPKIFLSTPSARRATICSTTRCTPCRTFLSTPSARRATSRSRRRTNEHQNFYPRPPRGGRLTTRSTASLARNFYPRPPRGGRPLAVAEEARVAKFLSTPSARRATPDGLGWIRRKRISIHALREEGDRWSISSSAPLRNFYPRPPRGGRLITLLLWFL